MATTGWICVFFITFAATQNTGKSWAAPSNTGGLEYHIKEETVQQGPSHFGKYHQRRAHHVEADMMPKKGQDPPQYGHDGLMPRDDRDPPQYGHDGLMPRDDRDPPQYGHDGLMPRDDRDPPQYGHDGLMPRDDRDPPQYGHDGLKPRDDRDPPRYSADGYIGGPME